MGQDKILLRPATVEAINAEVANYQARQEILEQAVIFMSQCAELALKDCMHENSVQARRLKMAIERAEAALK